MRDGLTKISACIFILCKIIDVDKNQDMIEVKLVLDDLGAEVKDISQDFQVLSWGLGMTGFGLVEL